MDICLINPPTTRDGGGPIYFPMSLLALASFIEREGFHSEIVDYDFELRTHCFPKEDFLRHAVKDLRRRFPSPIYGITSVTSNFGLGLLLAEEIKRQMPRATVVMGGPQISAVALETLTHFDAVDAAVVGEGEHTLKEYLEAFKKGSDVSSIPGLYTRDHLTGKVPFSKRALENSLDAYPPADFSKVPIKEYAVFERFNAGYFLPFIEAGRGCPFDCTFCSTAIMWSRKYRVKSPRRIYEELAELKSRYGFVSFELIHDNFTTSRKYLHEFCTELSTLNREAIRWSCASRVDTLYEEDLDLMERAGCDGIFFGVETGSARMQKVIRKEIDLSEYDSLVRACLKRDFRVNCGFILGFPEETPKDMDETIRCVLKSKRLGVAHPSLNRLKVLAGTELSRRHTSELTRPCDDELCGVEDDRVRELVVKFPSLFTSYYLVPHPLMENGELEELLAFCQVGTKVHHELFNWILERPGMDLGTLFSSWKAWKESLRPEGSSMMHRIHFVSENFSRFFRESLLPRLARSRRSQKIEPAVCTV